ncbi:hypothetical protein MMC28_000887 [Mycoblastus sanguinarius]|nr:hypothetical protein [Mycoblastus sanguinarius]
MEYPESGCVDHPNDTQQRLGQRSLLHLTTPNLQSPPLPKMANFPGLKLFGLARTSSSNSTKLKLTELPPELILTVADHLDVVSCVALTYTNARLRSLKINKSSLTPCAKSKIVMNLSKDRKTTPRMVPHGSYNQTCAKVERERDYCHACRCHGHSQDCEYCDIGTLRNCPREYNQVWRRWTRIKYHQDNLKLGAFCKLQPQDSDVPALNDKGNRLKRLKKAVLGKLVTEISTGLNGGEESQDSKKEIV